MASWLLVRPNVVEEIDFDANPVAVTAFPFTQAPNQFSVPRDISVDDEARWLVATNSGVVRLNLRDISDTTGNFGAISGLSDFLSIAFHNGQWYGVRNGRLFRFSTDGTRTQVGRFPAGFRNGNIELAIDSSGQGYAIHANSKRLIRFSLTNPAGATLVGSLPTAFDGSVQGAAFGGSPERLLVCEGITASHRNRIWRISTTSPATVTAPIWTETVTTSLTINGIAYGPTVPPPIELSIEFESGNPEFEIDGLRILDPVVDLSIEFESGNPEFEIGNLESIEPAVDLSIEFESGNPEFEIGNLRSVTLRPGRLLLSGGVVYITNPYETIERNKSPQVVVPSEADYPSIPNGMTTVGDYCYIVFEGGSVDGNTELLISGTETRTSGRAIYRVPLPLESFPLELEPYALLQDPLFRRFSTALVHPMFALISIGNLFYAFHGTLRGPHYLVRYNTERVRRTSSLSGSPRQTVTYWTLSSNLVATLPTEIRSVSGMIKDPTSSADTDLLIATSANLYKVSLNNVSQSSQFTLLRQHRLGGEIRLANDPILKRIYFCSRDGGIYSLDYANIDDEDVRHNRIGTFGGLGGDLDGITFLSSQDAYPPEPWSAWPHSGPTSQSLIGDLDESAIYEIRTRKVFDGRQPSEWSAVTQMETR